MLDKVVDRKCLAFVLAETMFDFAVHIDATVHDAQMAARCAYRIDTAMRECHAE